MPEFGKRKPVATFDVKDWDVSVPQERYDNLMRWLQSHGPDEWHGCAVTWNYGHGDAPLAWICMQDQCDAATVQDGFEMIEGEHQRYQRYIARHDVRLLPWTAPTPEQPAGGHVVDEDFFREGFPVILARDPVESRDLYLKSLSGRRHWSAKWSWELPPYWFGEKLGWISASEIPTYQG